MKKDQQGLFHSSKTEQQFLFYRTDEIAVDEKSGDIQAVLPGLSAGSSFFDRIAAEVTPLESFGVLAVRMDEHADGGKPQPEDALGIAEVLTAFCKTESCLLGQLDTFLFACVFPEKDRGDCVKAAGQIQQKISETGKNTVSVGIAVYPTLLFGKDQIIDNARKALDHAAFLGPNSTVVLDSVTLNISGDHFYQHKDMEKAVAEFTAALDLDPNNINVHNSLGVCYGVMGDFEKAIAHFETAVSLDPGEEMAWYNGGLVLKLTRNPQKALEYFLKAGALNPTRFEVAYQTGKIYMDLELTEKARPYFERAITLKPENGSGYRFLGECHTELGLIEQAISAFKRAIKENPQDSASLSALGFLFDKKGENPEISILFCQQSVDISPENGLFRLRLGHLYTKLNKFKNALAEFESASELGIDASEDIRKVKALINPLP
jgi:tetratricopeptide (TPR) repeat protein